MKKLNDREVIVGPVRLSYLNVFKPRQNTLKDGSPMEYDAVLLFPKQATPEAPSAVEELKELRSALGATVFAKWGANAPKNLRNPIRDGDAEYDNNGEARAPGYFFLNVSAQEAYPPLLIDARKDDARPQDWGSGDWGKVHLGLFAYDKKGNKGVGLGLRGIQFIHKGESLGGGGGQNRGAFDEEESLSSPAGAASPGQAPADYDPFADE